MAQTSIVEGRTAAIRAAAIALTVAALVGCSDNNLTSPTSAGQLDGTWRLFQMTTGAGVHNESVTAGRFAVTFSAGRIDAKADCNACTGAATLSGSTLTVHALACTRVACSSAPLDSQFTGVLDGPLTVRLNARLLQLNDTRGGELRFEK